MRQHASREAKGGALRTGLRAWPVGEKKKGIVLHFRLAPGSFGAWVNCDSIRYEAPTSLSERFTKAKRSWLLQMG